MTTWILIFYMSTNTYLNLATGGPATIDGFTSAEKCEQAKVAVEKLPKFDWAVCVEVKK